jgi:hypothetical protein
MPPPRFGHFIFVIILQSAATSRLNPRKSVHFTPKGIQRIIDPPGMVRVQQAGAEVTTTFWATLAGGCGLASAHARISDVGGRNNL